MRRKLLPGVVAAILVGVVAGCGGGDSDDGGGVVAAVTRAVRGQITWPGGLSVTGAQVTVSRLRAAGETSDPAPLATGTVAADGLSYVVPGVPANQLLVVKVQGTGGSGVIARLSALIGQTIGRADSGEVVVDVAGTTTIATTAVQKMVTDGGDPAVVNQTLVTKLETAAAPLVATTDFTSQTSVDQQAQQAITDSQASLPPLGQRAQDHIQAVLTATTGTLDIANEIAYFDSYHAANPTDAVGTLGYSITRVAAAADQLASKYGTTEYTGLVSFTRAVKIVRSGELTRVQDKALDVVTARSAGGGTITRHRGRQTTVAPTTVATDARQTLVPAIKAAIDALAPLTTSTTTLASFAMNGQTYTIRAEEVRAFRAALRSVLFLIDTATAYSWDDGGFNWNRTDAEMDLNKDGMLTPAEYLPGGTFMTLTNRAAMTEAWSALTGAVDDAYVVANKLATAPDTQQLLFSDNASTAGWTEVRDGLAEVRASLPTSKATKCQYWNPTTGADTQLILTINASALWGNPPADLKALAPTLAITTVGLGYTSRLIASVPDKTFGGVLPNAATEVPAAAWSQLFMGAFALDTWGYGSMAVTNLSISPSVLPHEGGTVTVRATISSGVPIDFVEGWTDGPQQLMLHMALVSGTGGAGTSVYEGTMTVPASQSLGWEGYGIEVYANGSSGASYGNASAYGSVIVQ